MAIPTVVQLKGGPTASIERFNYTGKHRYFLTLPVVGGRALFAGAEATVPVLDALREACWHHHFDVYAYCFLPARLVLIVRGREDFSQMKEFLRAFRERSNDWMKRETGKALWSKKYLERVLRKTELTSDAAREIFMLPVREGLVSAAVEYPLQGSFVEEIKRFVDPVRRHGMPHGRGRATSSSRHRTERRPGK